MPVIDLAVEVPYTDFGKPSQGVNAQQFELNLREPSFAGLLILPLGRSTFMPRRALSTAS